MSMYDQAMGFARDVIRNAKDWQDVEDALLNHDKIRPWLDATGDPVAMTHKIIRAAEKQVGDEVPY